MSTHRIIGILIIIQLVLIAYALALMVEHSQQTVAQDGQGYTPSIDPRVKSTHKSQFA